MTFPRNSMTFRFETSRVLGRLLAPEDFQWSTTASKASSEFLIHLSCNAHITAFVPYILQKILKKIDLDSAVLGGPENCCGHLHLGLLPELAPQTTQMAVRGFSRMKPKTVMTICPDCDDTFNKGETGELPFRYRNASHVILENMEKLGTLMKPLNKRVIVHAHHAYERRAEDSERIVEILERIPGLEILAASHAEGPGNHCQTMLPMPADLQAAMFEEARQLGADAIVVPYHSCYRQHIKMQLDYGVETVHYLGLVAEALGIPFDESLKRLRLLNDVDTILDRLSARIADCGYEVDEVRPYVQHGIFV